MAGSLRVMVVGGGGREHALAWKLEQSPSVAHIYVVPGNAGIADMSEKVSQIDGIEVDDFENLVALAKKLQVGLVVVGPDSAIVGGIREHFDTAGIPCFAPSKQAAQIEGSKVFAKDFMRRFHIPTAEYRTFDNFASAKEYILAISHRIVIKADGLAAGKGVVLPGSQDEAVEVLYEILVEGKFGASGASVVIEEFLEGQEASVSTFSDGRHTVSLSVGQDHKLIGDGDQGSNTGGMGVYAPVPVVSKEVMQDIEKNILQPTFDGFRQLGCPFVGLLFTGIMLTSQGPKVLEYNARFGDPETQSILPLIDPKVDLAEVMLACVQQRLHSIKVKQLPDFACGVVIVSEGYPGQCRKGDLVTLKPLPEGCLLFHAGTKLVGKQLTTAGGRVFTVVGMADSLVEAVSRAYAGVKSIQFEGMFYRNDIAWRALKCSQQLPEG